MKNKTPLLSAVHSNITIPFQDKKSLTPLSDNHFYIINNSSASLDYTESLPLLDKFITDFLDTIHYLFTSTIFIPFCWRCLASS